MGNINKLQKYILQGYNSIKVDIPKVESIQREYRYKGKVYAVYEYAFNFPYWYDKKDLFKIGVLQKMLEIAITYFPIGIEKLMFMGEILPIKKLEDFLSYKTIYKKMNPKCKYLIERIPFEINRDGVMGQYSTYLRVGCILKNG